MTTDFETKTLNRSRLLSLLARCRQLLEDTSIHERQTNRTVSNAGPAFSTSRESHDNAYFYILFVMLFYSFLAMALFKRFMGSDEENVDPYEELTGNRTAQTFNAGHTAEKFYFEEESSEPF